MRSGINGIPHWRHQRRFSADQRGRVVAKDCGVAIFGFVCLIALNRVVLITGYGEAVILCDRFEVTAVDFLVQIFGDVHSAFAADSDRLIQLHFECLVLFDFCCLVFINLVRLTQHHNVSVGSFDVSGIVF